MLKNFVKLFGGDPNKRTIAQFTALADEINRIEAEEYEPLRDDSFLREKTVEFRRRLAMGETLDDILPEAFAAVREASKRTVGLRHYDIQLIGGIVLHQGKIAEMRTGEGKTLVATLPLYLNALALNPAWVSLAREKWGSHPDRWQFQPLENTPVGRGVHLVTVNDYLARRDARWMTPIYDLLGLKVGVLQMAARTDHGKMAYLVDLEKSSPQEDQDQLVKVPRGEAYAADITYGTTNEFGFDYLRDNMKISLEERVQRGHYFAIIDEVDNVLIDEARTPLIISGPSHDDAENYIKMTQVVRQLRPEDYEIDERSRTVSLTEIGEIHVEQILGQPLRDPERPEDITPEQERLLGYLEQSLRAHFAFRRNKDYLVQGGKVIIIDESTGRLMPGRRWSDGLHQAVEAKEGVRVESENVTYATITIQNYYRMYEKLSGMTGTAATEAEEFHKIYELDVVEMPTNLDYQAMRPNTPLITKQAVDELGYKYTYYATKDAPDQPVFFKRKDYPDVIYRTEEAKFRAIGAEILRYHTLGRPILVGTTSVELSDTLSNRLKPDPIQKLAQVLILRNAWMEAHGREEDGRAIPELEFLNRPLNLLPGKQVAQMARELNLPLSVLAGENVERLLAILRLDSSDRERLANILKSGIPHKVLNAREHTKESKIIEDAGALHAVTIATNMAGRGVDIVLGGTLDNDTLFDVARIAVKTYENAGLKRDPNYLEIYERFKQGRNAFGGYGRSSNIQRLKRWYLHFKDQDLRAEIGIYDYQFNRFVQFLEEAEQVYRLEGLYVIGSERHESRRIDNQLRGRSARQGDPGASRFYLSLQDNLMRIFGGQQVENVMERMKVDEDFPLEMGLVSRIVEGSQARVEGANFDARKHLLEYDDVLNKQRGLIYSQRDRILTKDDLEADVHQMLETEVRRRVPEALADPEGPWKLLAWLEQIQPTRSIEKRTFPSFTLQLLLNEMPQLENSPPEDLLPSLLEIAQNALDAEEEHILNAIQKHLNNTLENLETQLEDRQDLLDTFIEGWLLEEDDHDQKKNARETENELTGLLRAPIKLDHALFKNLSNDPDSFKDAIQRQMETYLCGTAMRRVIAVAERFLRENLDLSVQQLTLEEWDAFGQKILESIQAAFQTRRERLFGETAGRREDQDGSLADELKQALKKLDPPLDKNRLSELLVKMSFGSRMIFDRKTKQRVRQLTTRLVYSYYAARLIEREKPDVITEQVLAHLQNAQAFILQTAGELEAKRFAQNPVGSLPKPVRAALRRTLGDQTYPSLENQELHTLPPEIAQAITAELGRQVLTRTYRRLMLHVIDMLWIDYLTQMEALRISVGLEAYAQRDPLVIYKSKASEMFANLINVTRTGVVSRMFTTSLQGGLEMDETGAETASQTEAPPEAAADPDLETEPSPNGEAQPARKAEPARAGQSHMSKSARRRKRRK